MCALLKNVWQVKGKNTQEFHANDTSLHLPQILTAIDSRLPLQPKLNKST